MRIALMMLRYSFCPKIALRQRRRRTGISNAGLQPDAAVRCGAKRQALEQLSRYITARRWPTSGCNATRGPSGAETELLARGTTHW